MPADRKSVAEAGFLTAQVALPCSGLKWDLSSQPEVETGRQAGSPDPSPSQVVRKGPQVFNFAEKNLAKTERGSQSYY